FSFLMLLHLKLFALLPEFEQLYPIGTIVTQDDFFDRFEYKKFIASGGESQVFKVCEKETNKEYALVVCSQYYGIYNDSDSYEVIVRRKSFVERMIQLQQYNPHQAVIHAYFWIKTMSLTRQNAKLYNVPEYYVNRYNPIPDGRFFNELSLDDVNTDKFKSLPEEIKGTLNCCMLLELGEADLESEEYKKKEIDKKLENLVTQISCHFIRHGDVIQCDYKLRNHIYIKSENVFYGDRAMSDYQYWHYVVNGKHFYIPALPIVIKRIDYGGWYLFIRDLSSNFKENNYSRRFFDDNDYLIYKEKPDVPDDQILDILMYTPE
ncbi:MAG: hypothetical protein Q8S31_04045, partial [Alphaproteobacteria bacterium]|nr:hypothetical protein [Alphaproteobacteria bacterium]